MGINWSAIAGGVGEAVNYHVDKRDEEAKRKRAFDDAVKMADINFGYSKQLAGIKNEATLEAARISARAKQDGYSYIDLPALGKFAPARRVRHTGQTDEMRFSHKNETVNNHFRSIFKAVKNGDLSQADATDLFEKSGASFFLTEHMQDQHLRRTVVNTKDGFAPPAINAVHGGFSTLDYTTGIINGLRGGALNEGQVAQRDAWNASRKEQPNVPKYNATFLLTTPLQDQNPNAVKLASTPDFRTLQAQVKSGDITDPEVVTSAARTILGTAADTMSGEQIDRAISDAFVYSGQRNVISNNQSVPNPTYPLINEGERSLERITTGANLIRSLESGAGILQNRKPLVTGAGVGTQSLFARAVGGFKEFTGLIDDNTKTFKPDQSGVLTEAVTKSLGNFDDGVEISNTLNKANAELETYMNSQRNDDGTYSPQALATYQFHMEKVFIAYQVAKFFGDSRVSNADFNNATNAMFGRFETDPQAQRDAFANGLMRLHFLVKQEVAASELSTRYSRRLIPGDQSKTFNISVGSGADTFSQLRQNATGALVRSDQTDTYWSGVLPKYDSSKPFVKPVEEKKPEVTTRKTGSGAAAAVARRPVKPNLGTQ